VAEIPWEGAERRRAAQGSAALGAAQEPYETRQIW